MGVGSENILPAIFCYNPSIIAGHDRQQLTRPGREEEEVGGIEEWWGRGNVL